VRKFWSRGRVLLDLLIVDWAGRFAWDFSAISRAILGSEPGAIDGKSIGGHNLRNSSQSVLTTPNSVKSILNMN
jgi:hypothetical protein